MWPPFVVVVAMCVFLMSQHIIKHDSAESIAIDKEDATISVIAEIVSDIESCVQGGSRDGRAKSPTRRKCVRQAGQSEAARQAHDRRKSAADFLSLSATLDGSFPYYIGHWSGLVLKF